MKRDKLKKEINKQKLKVRKKLLLENVLGVLTVSDGFTMEKCKQDTVFFFHYTHKYFHFFSQVCKVNDSVQDIPWVSASASFRSELLHVRIVNVPINHESTDKFVEDFHVTISSIPDNDEYNFGTAQL